MTLTETHIWKLLTSELDVVRTDRHGGLDLTFHTETRDPTFNQTLKTEVVGLYLEYVEPRKGPATWEATISRSSTLPTTGFGGHMAAYARAQAFLEALQAHANREGIPLTIRS